MNKEEAKLCMFGSDYCFYFVFYLKICIFCVISWIFKRFYSFFARFKIILFFLVLINFLFCLKKMYWLIYNRVIHKLQILWFNFIIINVNNILTNKSPESRRSYNSLQLRYCTWKLPRHLSRHTQECKDHLKQNL